VDLNGFRGSSVVGAVRRFFASDKRRRSVFKFVKYICQLFISRYDWNLDRRRRPSDPE
jgi:hypothetical protein